MSCGCQPPQCTPANFCPPENYGDTFPSLVGPPGPAGGNWVIVNTIAQLRAFNPTSFVQNQLVMVLGYYTPGDLGGGLFRYDGAGTDPDNGGTVIEPTTGPGQWNRLYTGPLNLRWFGAKGDGSNATAALRSAVAVVTALGGGAIYMPKGEYLTDTLTLTSDTRLYGDGCGATVLIQNDVTGASYGTVYANSGAANAWVDFIRVSDMTIDGRVGSLGFSEFKHLVSFNGVRNAIIERVEFLGFRGDGLYIGSGVSGGDERHNINVIARDCIFDGVNKDNRNGISVVDCDGLWISSSKFTRCTKSSMPGAIDIEPDNTFNVVRNLTVRSCQFYDIDGGAAVVTVLVSPSLSTPMVNVTLDNLEMDAFSNSNAVIVGIVRGAAITTATPDNHINVTNVHARGGLRGLNIAGVKSITFRDCSFSQMTQSSIISYNADANKCIDVTLQNVKHDRCGSTGGTGLDIFSVSQLRINGCTFSDCGDGITGYAIDFNGTVTSDNVTISNTSIFDVTGKTLVAIQKEAGHTFTQSTNGQFNNQFGSLVNNFSATGASNVPNYFAQAVTWTPTLIGDTTPGSNTYGLQAGTYVRIGNLVVASFVIVLTAKDGAMAGTLSIGGLPFSATALPSFQSGGAISGFVNLNLSAAGNVPGCLIQASTSKLLLYEFADNSGSTRLQAASVSNTTEIYGTIVYQVA